MKRSPEDDYPTPPRSTKRIRIRIRVEAKATNIRKKAPKAITIPPKSPSMDKIRVVHKVPKPPKGAYNEEFFDLTSCRLINPLPVKYELLTHASPSTGTRTPSDIEPRFWFPAPIEDDIKKRLFLHPRNRGIVWVGRFAEAKLEAEKKKYHRVKDLWLFEASDAYLPGYDKKAEFIARAFEDEMLSPWVVGWLRELIGAEAVGKILEHVEANLRRALARKE
ncbi:hypothetical protein KVR01_005475 [Diaporthe batatas]|uniref:uncharacterized protein n=1 Tax=Diaporthe batatas TaxID=748121 RepID=UPI001D0579C7|nr:uncharacterized protein KVR01_005475 [Diaporthe batatas]KAG8165200.1 hypothetical protein KVR01_005475 [Diaporthe batatas]